MDKQGEDSFTIGTASTKGCIKVYFVNDDAERKIQRAKDLYYKFVELDKLKGGLKRWKLTLITWV